MRLSKHEVEQFYRIWFPLLHYVNSRLDLVPEFSLDCVPSQDALVLRNALWEDPQLLETFLAKNPCDLSEDDVGLAASWRENRVSGRFLILRHLKKHAILLKEGPPAKAYAVLGLTSTLEEIVHQRPPVMIDAVLLPFTGRVTFDSLVLPYGITFGPGIRRRLNEEYREIQERGELITSLDSSTDRESSSQKAAAIATGNRKVVRAFTKVLASSGLSAKMIQHHTSAIEAFSRENSGANGAPISLCCVSLEDLQAHISRAPKSRGSLTRFVRFLRTSGRIESEAGWEMQDYLKSK